MTFDLKHFRQEVLKISQVELAQLLEVSRDKIVRMEDAPDKIELSLIIRLAQVTGQTLEELTGYKKEIPKTFTANNHWQSITKFITEVQDEFFKITNYKDLAPLQKMFFDFTEINKPKKPKVAVLGMSDAGKSTFINFLLGSNEIPAYWTPATSTNVHIKHVSDRPKYINDDVLVLDNERNKITIEMLDNHEYYEEHKITSGGLELLNEFGTRNGEFYDEDKNLLIIAYLNKEILNVCDLIDVPGFGTGDRTLDNTMANATQGIADIVIYLSPSNAFLRGEELQFLRSTINILPPIERKNENIIDPLGNLYVVASQALAVDNGNVNSLATILDNGADRLFTDINSEIWEKRSKFTDYDYNYEDLRKRFFTFAIDRQQLRDSIEIDLKRLLETLPQLILKNYQAELSDFFIASKNEFLSKANLHETLLKRRDEFLEMLVEIDNNLPHEERLNESLRKEMLNKIRALKTESLSEFRTEYNLIINEDHLLEVIKRNNYKKKKQDIQRLSGYISSELGSKLEAILVKKSEELSDVIEEYLKEISNNFNSTSNKFYGVNVDNNISFDVKHAFASGLAGVATFGGLAIWASTLGNLGAYILVAQSVSLLSALGISVGGTAAAISAVAAIGGPITLGIALAVITSLSTYAITSGTWKKSISKKIVKEYGKQNAFEKYEEVINDFWQDTEKAFEKADDVMKLEARNRVQTIKGEIDNLDEDYLKNESLINNNLVSKTEHMYNFINKSL